MNQTIYPSLMKKTSSGNSLFPCWLPLPCSNSSSPRSAANIVISEVTKSWKATEQPRAFHALPYRQQPGAMDPNMEIGQQHEQFTDFRPISGSKNSEINSHVFW
jgi:hypothetical protein